LTGCSHGTITSASTQKQLQAAQQITRQVEARSSTCPEPLLKETTRLALASMAYAAGFAFFSGDLPRRQNTARSVGTVGG